MNQHIHSFPRRRLGAVLVWLSCGMATLTRLHGQTYPPPVGAGIVATVQADQGIYTNIPPTVWCPPCVTDTPPCMLPCFLIEGKPAVARFSFEVSNQYPTSRAFQFSSGQQFDVELIDASGRIVAAWSDGMSFIQTPTSFTLDPGATMAFSAEIVLQDRQGQQLNGVYQVHAFLTTTGPYPRVQTTLQIAVMLAPNG